MNMVLHKSQSGIAAIVVIIAALVVTGGSGVAYTRVQHARQEKRLQEEQKIAAQSEAHTAAINKTKRAQADAKQEAQPETDTSPGSETNETAPLSPVTAAPNTTPFASEIGCDSYTTAYASKTSGITFYTGYGAAYNNDKEGSQTIPYRTSIQVRCQDGDVVSASYSGEEGAVKVGDLSRTKP
jgi:Tfp pilus assembly protein PilV